MNGNSHSPGPGAYDYTRPLTAAPKYGFGSSTRDASAYEALKYLPGPGAYEIKGGLINNRGVTMTSRKVDQSFRDASKMPGPGSYEPDFHNKKNYGNVRIGSATRDNLIKESLRTPGPGAYESRIDGIRNKEPAIRMGTSQRRPLSANTRNPGPGAYEIPSRMFEGPKVKEIFFKFIYKKILFITKPNLFNIY